MMQPQENGANRNFGPNSVPQNFFFVGLTSTN